MKLLEKGRRTLNWMGIHFSDDDPVNRKIKLAQNASTIIFVMLFITIATLHVKSFLNLRIINPEEFFFILTQFVMAAHGSSAFITIYSSCNRITTVFQCLTEIYEKCKQNES